MINFNLKTQLSGREVAVRALFVVVTVAIIVWFLPRPSEFNYKVEVNAPWRYPDLTASFEFPVYKTEEAMKRELKERWSRFVPYYVYDASVGEYQAELLRHRLERMSEGSNRFFRLSVCNSLLSIYQNEIVDSLTWLQDRGIGKVLRKEGRNVQEVNVRQLITPLQAYKKLMNDPTVKLYAELLGNVNRVLCEENQANMFITVWIGIIDLPTGRMRCANAGHEYPVVMPIGGEYSFVKDRHSLALGIMAGIPITEYELTLRPGDRLFVYTDGVPEAINEQKEAYGPERMLAKLNTLRNAGEKETLTALREDVRGFEGAEEQFDDITMIGFTYFGPGGPHGNAADADEKPQEQGITENSK